MKTIHHFNQISAACRFHHGAWVVTFSRGFQLHTLFGQNGESRSRIHLCSKTLTAELTQLKWCERILVSVRWNNIALSFLGHLRHPEGCAVKPYSQIALPCIDSRTSALFVSPTVKEHVFLGSGFFILESRLVWDHHGGTKQWRSHKHHVFLW